MTITRRTLLKEAAAGGILMGSSVFLAACSGSPGSVKAKNDALEIFSWWTSGGEVQALAALYSVYRKQYPAVKITNSAIGGASGGANMMAVLQSRMLGHQPPDSFQGHPGAEFIDQWVKTGAMDPIDQLYKDEGYAKVLPAALIESSSWQGKPYCVAVDAQRSNLTLYNKALMSKVGGSVPTTWDEFFTLAEKAKAMGIPALGLAESGGNSTQALVEKLLLAKLGPDAYQGLFTGKTDWGSQGVTTALETAARCFSYVNSDFLSVIGSDLPSLVSSGKALLIMNGDWCIGQFEAKKFTDYGWASAPDTDGMFILNSDSFGLPKGAPDPTPAMNWLKVVGSKEGQDGFNPLKGSISPRSDRDDSHYNAYQHFAVDQWETAKVFLPTLTDGSAASTQFTTAYANAMQSFNVSKNPESAQAALVKAAKSENFAS